MTEKEIFKMYYNEEKKFFTYLEKITEKLYLAAATNDIFKENDPFDNVNKRIRTVRKFKNKNVEIECKKYFEKISHLYKKVFKKNRLPAYFPVFFSNVNSISLNTSIAYSVRTYKIENCKEKLFWFGFAINKNDKNDSLYEIKKNVEKELQEKNIEFEVINDVFSDKDNSYDVYDFYIDLKSLMLAYNLKKIIVRFQSGFQYCCTVKENAKNRGVKSNFGFILVDYLSDPEIVTNSNKLRRNDFYIRKEKYLIKLKSLQDWKTVYEIYRK